MGTDWNTVTLDRRVHLRKSLNAPELDEAAVRAAIVSLAAFATREAIGRNKGDPVFELVTEGRQACWTVNGKVRCYSGCGDLVHFAFFRAAGASAYPDDPKVRATLAPWINRREAFGWKQGANLSRFVFSAPKGAWKFHCKGEPWIAKPGDAVVIGEGGAEHALIVRSFDPATGTLVSFDYGQWFAPAPNMPGEHGGKQITRRAMRGTDGRLWLYSTTPPGRPLLGRLDAIAALQPSAAAGDLLPALVPSSFPDGLGLPDDNPYL